MKSYIPLALLIATALTGALACGPGGCKDKLDCAAGTHAVANNNGGETCVCDTKPKLVCGAGLKTSSAGDKCEIDPTSSCAEMVGLAGGSPCEEAYACGRQK